MPPASERDAVAARYEPAVAVGGDWYDVIELPGGRLGLVVGDCVGRGPAAAAVMAELRRAAHALIAAGRQPADVLAGLDGAAEEIRGARSTTVFCAVVDPDRGTVAYASAGHPPALVVARDGAIRRLDGAGSLPLATRPTRRTGATAVLPDGAILALYTDGLVERRGESLAVGLDRLAAAIARGRAMALDDLAGTVVPELRPARPEDDVALLLYRRPAADDRRFHAVLSARPQELAPLRAQLRGWLSAHRAEAIADAVLVSVGEACTNAIEHAYGRRGDGRIEVCGRVERGVVELIVRDRGSWKAPQPADPGRGRGRQLMEALMDGVSVEVADGTLVRMRKAVPDAGGAGE